MSQYDNSNRIAIWKNEKKAADTHPDFRGQGEVNGVEVVVAAWKRKPGANPSGPALTIKVENKADADARLQEWKSRQTPQAAPAQGGDDFDTDIPF